MIKQFRRRALAHVEQAALRQPRVMEHTPLFIVSLPPPGSTLLYLLLQRFRLCYFPNLMARLPDSPATVGRLRRHLGGASNRHA